MAWRLLLWALASVRCKKTRGKRQHLLRMFVVFLHDSICSRFASHYVIHPSWNYLVVFIMYFAEVDGRITITWKTVQRCAGSWRRDRPTESHRWVELVTNPHSDIRVGFLVQERACMHFVASQRRYRRYLFRTWVTYNCLSLQVLACASLTWQLCRRNGDGYSKSYPV